AWHSYTGWEIHPITGTRPSNQLIPTTLGTYFWTTLIFGIALVSILAFSIYRWWFSPRQVVAQLGKAGSDILVPEHSGTSESRLLNALNSRHPEASRDWHRHLTLSLALLSLSLATILGWEFDNNVYAQLWISQNLAMAGLAAILVTLGIVLLPLVITKAVGVIRRKKEAKQ